MTDKIRVLIVDDLVSTRESVAKLLQFEPTIELVGDAGTGLEAIEKAMELQPDIVMMDINLPDIDGITASKKIITSLPATQIIMMSVQSDADYMRRAMVAGARDFLTKPFSIDELLTAVQTAYERRKETALVPARALEPVEPTPDRPPSRGGALGHVVAVYSPKGGTGCTTVAVNVAVSLAQRGHSTMLVDGSLQFGDVAVMLNLKSMNSILDLVERTSSLDAELIRGASVRHSSGLQVLTAPTRPEMAEAVEVANVELLLERLRRMYNFVIVDTGSKLDDVTLAILEKSDRILLISQQELPGITSASRFLDLSQRLEYDTGKILLVVNGMTEKQAISPLDVSRALKRSSPLIIPSDTGAARSAANQGRPLISGRWRGRPISQALEKAAERLEYELEEAGFVPAAERPGRGSLWERTLARVFGNA